MHAARERGCLAAHRAEARRRDGDIAPYRHDARGGAGTRAWSGAGEREGREMGGAFFFVEWPYPKNDLSLESVCGRIGFVFELLFDFS